MPHLVLLGLEVELVGGLGGYDGGEAFGDVDSGGFERFDLLGVVGHQADGVDAERLEDLGGKLEVAAIGGVAEFEVGLDGVASAILQLIGLELGHQADAAAFLIFVKEDSAAFVGDGRQGEFKLLPTVAAQGVEDIAGKALGVDTDDRRWARDISHHECDCGFDADSRCGKGGVAGLRVIDDALETEDAEVPPAGRKVGIGHLAYGEKRHRPIIRRAVRVVVAGLGVDFKNARFRLVW